MQTSDTGSAASAGLTLEEALPLAEALREWLAPECERIEVAGSIRRRRPFVRDIELVVIPRTTPLQPGLLGDDTDGERLDLLDDRLRRLRHAGRVHPHIRDDGRLTWGPKLKRIQLEDVVLDLFSVLPPAQWGVQLLIRTGPASFSKRFVTPRLQGGLLPIGYRVRDGRIVDGRGNTIETPEEEDVFRFLGIEPIAPERRE